MSPEMLSQDFHTRMVDFYSLGALLYEMITGLPPLYSQDREEMYRNIVTKEVEYHAYLSSESVSLLKVLLAKDPSKRMGAKQGIKEVKQSDFCRGIDWDLLLKRKIKRPNASSKVDLLKQLHFDPEYTDLTPRLSLNEDARGEDIDLLSPGKGRV